MREKLASSPTGATHADTQVNPPTQRILRELLVNASIEVTVGHLRRLEKAAPLLPAGSCAYVPSLPNQSFGATLKALEAIRRLGLDPVPHLAARRVRSREVLVRFLRSAVTHCGVHRVMLIAGDDPRAELYQDSVELLRDGVLGEVGIGEVGIAGFPEGHPHRNAATDLLAQKFELATGQGLASYIVTQFSFVPERILEFCADLARHFPEAGVYVGIAGPTDPVALLRYAQRCGVSASRRALTRLGFGVARLAIQTDPSAHLVALARYCEKHPDHVIVGAHLYGFGGVVRTARWMHEIVSDTGGT